MIKYLTALVLLACPLQAQRFVWDPDTKVFSRTSLQHFEAGAGIDVAMQVVSWPKKPWERVATVALIGLAYEYAQEEKVKERPERGPGLGFGLMDLGLDIAGALVSEGVSKLLRKIF